MGNLAGGEHSGQYYINTNCCTGNAAPTQGHVHVAATPIINIMGVPAYHTSIILGEHEYFFNQYGIQCCEPLLSHPTEQKLTKTFICGDSILTGTLLIKYLDPYFAEGSYDIISKNCNSFTDAALYFLTRTRLDARFNRLERMVRSVRPVSIRITKLLIQAFVSEGPSEAEEETQQITPWIDNPRAKLFSVEEIVATCDAFDVEASKQTKLEEQKTCLWYWFPVCKAENTAYEGRPNFKTMARLLGRSTYCQDGDVTTITV